MQSTTYQDNRHHTTKKNRTQLLADIPITERRIDLAGISTAVLIGGEGSPVILLHGPGETSIWWMRVIPKLVKSHHVIVPDLPGHGETGTDGKLDEERVLTWLEALIAQTCSTAPTLVGHILGGSIAARFTTHNGEQISRLVLVDSLGLGKFRPAPGFAFGLIRFMLWPTEKNYLRFFPQCMYDVDDLRTKMGKNWESFLSYLLDCARDPDRKAAMQSLMKTVGVPRIPSGELEKINVPTALIWGRHDKANKLSIAESASKRYGWPLHIIEETRDDPKLERPEAFINALYKIINTQ